MYYTLRIIEKLLIVYFSLYIIVDILLYIYAIITFLRKKTSEDVVCDFNKHFISIIVPAFNEEVSIITCTEMLLKLDYPNYEVILVNDGSKDKTMDILTNHYKLVEIDKTENTTLTTKHIRHYYKVSDKNLLIIDKENGGKADSINAGINYANGDYVCTIDADSILDKSALKEVIKPFIKNKDTIVSGGQLAVANDLELVDNIIVNSKVPSNIWVKWQIIEYIKSFMISRIGLSKLNALLIMSGAFSLFKKNDLLKVGGFLTSINTHPYIAEHIGIGKQTVCEDMEIIVRLWKFSRDQNKKAEAIFLPRPVCWTEVPDNTSNLYKQRSRWHQGMGETLNIHKKMIFEPKYGITGLIGLPYYLFFEFLSPLIKIFSIIFIVVVLNLGMLNPIWGFLLLITTVLTTAIIMSSIMAVIEYWSKRSSIVNRKALRYKTFTDWIGLILAGILAEFSYSFFKIAAQTSGIYNFYNNKHDWRKFERRGVNKI